MPFAIQIVAIICEQSVAQSVDIALKFQLSFLASRYMVYLPWPWS